MFIKGCGCVFSIALHSLKKKKNFIMESSRFALDELRFSEGGAVVLLFVSFQCCKMYQKAIHA